MIFHMLERMLAHHLPHMDMLTRNEDIGASKNGFACLTADDDLLACNVHASY